jgi:hypothetical protein
MSKSMAGKLENDWECGFCVGPHDADSNGGSGRSHNDVQNDIEELEVEQSWSIKRKSQKWKNKPGSGQEEDVLYTRFWSQTPAYFRVKKKSRVVQYNGYATWDDLDAAIVECSEKNMVALKALKKAAAGALKDAGHHVSDSQGAHGLQDVCLSAEVIDQLEDENLLNVEEVVAGALN